MTFTTQILGRTSFCYLPGLLNKPLQDSRDRCFFILFSKNENSRTEDNRWFALAVEFAPAFGAACFWRKTPQKIFSFVG